MTTRKEDTIDKTNVLTSNRKKSRKLLFQELYAKSFNEFDVELFKESFFDNVFTFTQDDNYIKEMEKIIPFYEPFFISIFKEYAPKFKIENMSLSYILPVYIGLAEMFFITEEIPGKVSINEAVEIAKVY
jgi:transcription termination factor NusB